MLLIVYVLLLSLHPMFPPKIRFDNPPPPTGWMLYYIGIDIDINIDIHIDINIDIILQGLDAFRFS